MPNEQLLPSKGPVLVCTRLDETDATTVRAGASWAALLGAPLVVCHVVSSLFGAMAGVGAAKRVMRRYLERHVPEHLARTRTVVADGDAEQAIVHVARRFEPRLVVTGASEDWALWPRSHITEEVLRQIDASLVVVRGEPGPGPVLVGTDFSPAASSALSTAAVVAQRRGSSLLAVHAMDDVDLFERVCRLFQSGERAENAARAEAYLKTRELQDATRPLGGADVEVVDQAPVAGLLDASERHGAELLVVGAVGGKTQAALGRTALHLARRAPCSVLVVRGDLLERCGRPPQVDSVAA